MKKYIHIKLISLLLGCLMLASCGDSFLEMSPTDRQEAGKPATEEAIKSFLAGAYQPMLFDSYAGGNYNSIVLMSDLRSDDIFKGGGDLTDQVVLYKVSQFTTNGRETLSGLWSVFYNGLARSNNLLDACSMAVNVKDEDLAVYTAEGHFLRAYYMHLLWKFFGNVPYFDKALEEPYVAKQYTADEIYEIIMADIAIAEKDKVLDMNTMGNSKFQSRASHAALLMLKARVVLYQKDASRYAEITKDMAEIIKSGKFDLFDNFATMWEETNEFCVESIFETNQLPEGKTWGNAWQGYGTNLPAFISPNGLLDPNKIFKGGWGFAPVRKTTYAIFENGDKRRDASINYWDASNYSPRFQDTGYFLGKYAAREGYNPEPGDVDLNYSNNLRIFRYAETLLNYAELVKMHGQAEVNGVTAQSCLDKVRSRAFGANKSIPATAENIKLERRREFVGEGMRFWDLVRWGDAERVLTEDIDEYSTKRTFQDWMKHLPIPQEEIDKTKGSEFPLEQVGNWN